MENDRGAKRVYVRECAGNRSVDRLRKRWIDTMKTALRKEVWVLGNQGEWWMIGWGL